MDLYEINEAFAVVSLLAIQELGLDEDKVNVNGGACALSHPIGFSGSRIVVTLINVLQQLGLTKGVTSLCIGEGSHGGGYRYSVGVQRRRLLKSRWRWVSGFGFWQ